MERVASAAEIRSFAQGAVLLRQEDADAQLHFILEGEVSILVNGRPIILRGYDRTMSFEDAVKLMMVSFDSTLKANLSVGLPLDMLVIEKDLFEPLHSKRITAADPYFQKISSGWGEALKRAFYSLPDYSFEDETPITAG